MTKDTLPPNEPNNSDNHYTFNSIKSQRVRLFNFLREHGEITTTQARKDLDIMMPAPRIFELRSKGHEILTVKTPQATECGRKHRAGKYILIREAK